MRRLLVIALGLAAVAMLWIKEPPIVKNMDASLSMPTATTVPS